MTNSDTRTTRTQRENPNSQFIGIRISAEIKVVAMNVTSTVLASMASATHGWVSGGIQDKAMAPNPVFRLSKYMRENVLIHAK
jgi:hypothetical protein